LNPSRNNQQFAWLSLFRSLEKERREGGVLIWVIISRGVITLMSGNSDASKTAASISDAVNSYNNDNNNNILVFEDDEIEHQRRRMEEFATDHATKRVAEEAQDEEILRLALELSVSENSDRNLLLSAHSQSEHVSSTGGCGTIVPVRGNVPSQQQPLSSQSSHSHQQQQHRRPILSIQRSAQSFDYAGPEVASAASTATAQQPVPAPPALRSVLRQRLRDTSTRSLEEFIFGGRSCAAVAAAAAAAVPPSMVDGGILSRSRSIGGGSEHIPRTASERIYRPADGSCQNSHANSSSASFLEDLLLDFEVGVDDDDDDDDDFWEDLDPDDEPELRRVQQHQEIKSNVQQSLHSEGTAASAAGGETTNRRKATSMPVATDLVAATERFQQMSSSLSSMDRTHQHRPRMRRPRPGLVVSVSEPAPKVKPPGRHRTAVSLQSPAIDDDELKKIRQSSSRSNPSDSTTTEARGGGGGDDYTSSSRPGTAVSVAAHLPTKTPEVRSAIISHIIGGGGGGSSSSQPSTPFSPALGTPSNDVRTSSAVGSESSLPLPILDRSKSGGSSDRSFDRYENSSRKPSKIIEHYDQYDPLDVDGSAQLYKDAKDNPHDGAVAETSTTRKAWNRVGVQKKMPNSADSSLSDWPTPSEQREWTSSSLPTRESSVLQSSALDHLEGTNDLTVEERRDIERAMRASQISISSERSTTVRTTSDYDLTGALEYLSEEELLNIQEALNSSVTPPPPGCDIHDSGSDDNVKPAATVLPVTSVSEQKVPETLQEDEAEAIARALREADEEEERRSLELAVRMQQEEARQFSSGGSLSISKAPRLQQQGNVRSMTRAEYDAQQFQQYRRTDDRVRTSIHDDDGYGDNGDDHLVDGYRMNSSAQHKWSRRDQSSIVGPNQEVRTKHDTTLHNEANAHRLGLLAEENANVGNQAYNSFFRAIKGTKKGVAMKGTGRAGSDADATKGGAMDPKVREHITRAINSEIIEKCNGVVKEGKEAMVYHADKGAESGGFDVAVKVFKKIQEFRNRGFYVDGDPRYERTHFRNLSSVDQLELWAEKEFRNLTRASRAGVPVPIPLFHKDNIVFMRFLGEDGWPAPQLRELNLNHGSQRWYTLFSQVMEAVKQ
jgi:RIO1 family